MNPPYPLIILAGGKSQRMGMAKGLLPAGDKTLLETQCESFAAAGGRDVILVLGHATEEYFARLAWLREGTGNLFIKVPLSLEEASLRLRVVVNLQPERGPFSSLQTGLAAIVSSAAAQGEAAPQSSLQAYFVLPVDVPGPDTGTWAALAAAAPEAEACVPVYNERGGHPVVLSARFVRKLLKLNPADPAARLDVQMQNLKSAVARVAVKDSSVLRNLNSPEEV